MGAISNMIGIGKLEARMEAIVFRQKGTQFQHPKTGKTITVPGGEWVDGKEGTRYDYDVLTKESIQVRAWKWALIKLRMKLETALRNTLGAIVKHLKGGSK